MSLWNLEIVVWAMSLKWGLPSSEHTQTGSCPAGMNLLDGSCPVRDEPQRWVFALCLSSEGFSPQSIDKLAVAQSGMNLPDSSYPIGDEPWRLLSGDDLSG